METHTFKKIKNPDQEVLNVVRFDEYGKYLAASYHYPQPKILFFSCDKEIKQLGEIAVIGKIISFDLIKSASEPFFVRCNTNTPDGEGY
jgi:hypothetical protein